MLEEEGVDTKQFDCAECTIPSGMKPPPVEPVTPPVEPVTPPVEPVTP